MGLFAYPTMARRYLKTNTTTNNNNNKGINTWHTHGHGHEVHSNPLNHM